MEFRKNDIVTLEIVDCGTDGEGIGKADGFTVFVKDAAIRMSSGVTMSPFNYATSTIDRWDEYMDAIRDKFYFLFL